MKLIVSLFTKRNTYIYVTILMGAIFLNSLSYYPEEEALQNRDSFNDETELPMRRHVTAEPGFYRKSLILNPGSSIDMLLMEEEISGSEIVASSRALKKVFNPSRLKAGSRVTLHYDWDNRSEFVGYEAELGFDKKIQVFKNSEGEFSGSIYEVKLDRVKKQASGVIQGSLYSSAVDSGIPANIVMNTIHLYSFDVDFQRDIQEGHGYEIIYENLLNEEGEVVKHGSVIGALLKLEDRFLPVYRWETGDGKVDYFNMEGHSARKSLLKTPVNGAYISSNVGMRRHPISGYTSFHRGTDFAARTGSPIMASGDGYITRILKKKTGYGFHIMIKHPNGYETLYAHMSAFARGMKHGRRVKQGEIIGYVGSTGMSTGPHLHYEVRYEGRYLSPNMIKIPPGRILKGEELKEFKTHIEKYPFESLIQ